MPKQINQLPEMVAALDAADKVALWDTSEGATRWEDLGDVSAFVGTQPLTADLDAGGFGIDNIGGVASFDQGGLIEMFNTADESTNFERFRMGWGLVNPDTFEIITDAGGSGTKHPLVVDSATWQVEPSGDIVVGQDIGGVTDLAIRLGQDGKNSGFRRRSLGQVHVVVDGSDEATFQPGSVILSSGALWMGGNSERMDANGDALELYTNNVLSLATRNLLDANADAGLTVAAEVNTVVTEYYDGVRVDVTETAVGSGALDPGLIGNTVQRWRVDSGGGLTTVAAIEPSGDIVVGQDVGTVTDLAVRLGKDGKNSGLRRNVDGDVIIVRDGADAGSFASGSFTVGSGQIHLGVATELINASGDSIQLFTGGSATLTTRKLLDATGDIGLLQESDANQSGTMYYDGARVDVVETALGDGTDDPDGLGNALTRWRTDTGTGLETRAAIAADGTLAQYNVAGTDFERVRMGWGLTAADTFEIIAEAGGTGTQRKLALDGSELEFFTGGVERWRISGGGRLVSTLSGSAEFPAINLTADGTGIFRESGGVLGLSSAGLTAVQILRTLDASGDIGMRTLATADFSGGTGTEYYDGARVDVDASGTVGDGTDDPDGIGNTLQRWRMDSGSGLATVAAVLPDGVVHTETGFHGAANSDVLVENRFRLHYNSGIRIEDEFNGASVLYLREPGAVDGDTSLIRVMYSDATLGSRIASPATLSALDVDGQRALTVPGSADGGSSVQHGEVQTTDTETVTLASFTAEDLHTYWVEAYVSLISGTATGEYDSMLLGCAALRDDAGSGVTVGSKQVVWNDPWGVGGGGAEGNVTFDTSGNDVRVRVTGLAASTPTTWRCTLRYQKVSN